MKIHSLKSGSKGNASLVYTDKTKILVDCGISGKAVKTAMADIGFEPGDLDGIVVTHEHADHIKGIGVMMRRYNVPVYANSMTWSAIMTNDLGKLNDDKIKIFEGVEPFSIGDIGIKPFSIPHDAAYPVGYCFDDGRCRAAVATDMGFLTEEVFREIGGCKTVLLESNHDIGMLEVGPYPYPLKQRILGKLGHLSNDDAAKATEFLVRMGAEKIILGHLSEENNYPKLAYETVKFGISKADIAVGRDLELLVAT